MNRSALKKYAPQARLDFIEVVTLRARRLGLDPAIPVSVTQTGDVLLIGGQPFPASVAKQRTELVRRIQQQGFNDVIEALAYTWFNRLVAIRFMELKGYLSHGYRVLSHPQGQQPEILDYVQHLDLPGLDKAEIIRLKTAGNQDEALYRKILLAQCHELHRNMPFLFEALDDATELLLPDNLLRTDSPIAHLISEIEEADWQEVEVIGWLYQFYISDKKDEVMGKVVKSEDIPAATQLFTPNWIVQYLVQNSLGRLWLMANPGSTLREKGAMKYYVEPAEQTPDVQAQLDALIKVRMDEYGGTLNPESLTVLDPACGSGHILVEAYNLLRAIYEERGYRLREIPRLILQKNLYGLDIDDRAAQLAGFALLMKAREDDRRLFDDEENPPHLNVMAIQQSAGLPDQEMARVIHNAAIQIEGGDAFHSGQLFGGDQLITQHSSGVTVLDLRHLIQLFEHGKTFGSLISVPEVLKTKLGKIIDLLASVRSKGDDLSRSYARQVMEQFAWPASLLALQYDAVVANPPYMGGKGMNSALKEFAKKSFPDSKADLFAMFIERGFLWCKPTGFNSMVTMQSWMFLSSYLTMREKLLVDRTIHTMAHLGARAFSEISGEVVQTTAFVMQGHHLNGFKPVFFRLIEGVEAEKEAALLSGHYRYDKEIQEDFSQIPGSPIAYWASSKIKASFSEHPSLARVGKPRQGLATTDNERFLRFWHECALNRIFFSANNSNDARESQCRWFPCQKGGGFKKWYGNNEYVVDWEGDGKRIKDLVVARYGSASKRVANESFYFKSGITWATISSASLSMRFVPNGFIFETKGAMCFFDSDVALRRSLGFCNSVIVNPLLNCISPTLDFHEGPVGTLPIADVESTVVDENVQCCIDLSKVDWDESELSWDFSRLPVVTKGSSTALISEAWGQLSVELQARIELVKSKEEENNRIFLDAYGLKGEIASEIPEVQVTLSRASRDKDMQRLISYAIGCIMGRYSLDEPGLIYAHSGGVGFDPSRYLKMPADADGIIPITDESWFEDDAAERVREFVKVVWGAETHVENMEWLADGLGRKVGESADEAIRRYLSTSFYKDHLQTYKKRPIYWLFSSGKQKAFECLVYLHRYNEGTLSRMRMEYVVPLQSRMQARIDTLTDGIDSVTSSAQQKVLQKRKDKFTKQLEELRRFDENLRPYADQRITLDLDDGVKVNYGKFGNLLAEVKAITGGKEE
ncbi:MULTISPECIES: BREX-1 system adenine-specific DNA-methyltransferase PglX [unclassified Pseudomonas]|uniref:BREX-1 system adenine-specific DNA-methyltransferase PglX n=1 Tax=unclassified Pseudomonas TaxID=196821 RepID=UPI000C889C5C|nr:MULTISPECIES: BREX-1 system adenine-specific DNA-methyltransferase PglX [unclassified Pseudomonas]PMZ92910.1 SAM-dependent methyltransferase [Pseudomonas sp. FW305-42]PNA20774.1 SAM-dependent methyltransferase [Pseudomonas sp. MPR-R1B]PNB23551.1 SAM-dependent methyltransferase [Pseudomonas sp. DP16D-E2]PNB41330.1 SAM-dependent methyltransferase [Pseudomonas sp. FW305-17]PNB59469.1 SAM-dependent methyltransferase [Pseudomonas sp. GW531-E2]